MADKAFRNVIDGELVDAASGETYDVLDPTTGEVYGRAGLPCPRFQSKLPMRARSCARASLALLRSSSWRVREERSR